MSLLSLTFGKQVMFEVFCHRTNDVISGAYFQADVAYGVDIKDHFICFVQAWLFRENTELFSNADIHIVFFFVGVE